MKIVVLLTALALAVPSIGTAHPLLGERVVTILPPRGQDAEIAQFRCGDYFLFQKDPPMKPPGPRIAYGTEERPDDPKNFGVSGVFLQSKFQVVIDNTKPRPTAEMVLLQEKTGLLLLEERDGRASMKLVLHPDDVERVVVRLSKADYDKASSCLPRPSRI